MLQISTSDPDINTSFINFSVRIFSATASCLVTGQFQGFFVFQCSGSSERSCERK